MPPEKVMAPVMVVAPLEAVNTPPDKANVPSSVKAWLPASKQPVAWEKEPVTCRVLAKLSLPTVAEEQAASAV